MTLNELQDLRNRLSEDGLSDTTLDLLFPELLDGPRCESGWTRDRCTFRLFHDGRHSND